MAAGRFAVRRGDAAGLKEFGHRLFVTTMELAAFVYELEMGAWPNSLGGPPSLGWPGMPDASCRLMRRPCDAAVRLPRFLLRFHQRCLAA